MRFYITFSNKKVYWINDLNEWCKEPLININPTNFFKFTKQDNLIIEEPVIRNWNAWRLIGLLEGLQHNVEVVKQVKGSTDYKLSHLYVLLPEISGAGLVIWDLLALSSGAIIRHEKNRQIRNLPYTSKK